MPNQPLGQPGYNGKLFGVVMNMSDKPIEINHGERMFTLEVVGVDNSEVTELEELSTDQITKKGESMKEFAKESIKTSFHREFIRLHFLAKDFDKTTNDFKEKISKQYERQMRLLTLVGTMLTAMTILVAIITVIITVKKGI